MWLATYHFLPHYNKPGSLSLAIAEEREPVADAVSSIVRILPLLVIRTYASWV